MDAADPTARAALALLEFGDGALDVVVASSFLLDFGVPADPLVASQGRETLPGDNGARRGREGPAQVVGKLVNGAFGEGNFGHGSILPHVLTARRRL